MLAVFTPLLIVARGALFYWRDHRRPAPVAADIEAPEIDKADAGALRAAAVEPPLAVAQRWRDNEQPAVAAPEPPAPEPTFGLPPVPNHAGSSSGGAAYSPLLGPLPPAGYRQRTPALVESGPPERPVRVQAAAEYRVADDTDFQQVYL